MKEFQEENLFKGAAQSQGFAPMQAPDTSRFLRENMAQVDQNFAKIQSQQQATLDAKLQKQLKTLEAFGQFSTKAMEFAQTMGKAYVDSQIAEGHIKALSLGKENNFGIPLEKEQQFNQVVAEEEKGLPVLAKAAQEVGQNGGSPEAIEYIKSLSHYQRIGASRAYFANKGKGYQDYLNNFALRKDVRIPKPAQLGGGFATPQEAANDPNLRQSFLATAERLYLNEVVGISRDNNPTGVSAKPLYEAMSEATDTWLKVARRNQAIRDSETRQFNAEEILKGGGSFSAFINEITGTYDSDGRQLTRSDAITRLEEITERERSEGRAELYSRWDTEIVEGDESGKTFRQRFANRLDGSKGLDSRIEDIQRRERALAEEADAQQMRDLQTYFQNIVKERIASGKPPLTDGQIDEIRRGYMAQTGKPASAFNWLTEYQTVEEQDAEKEGKALLAKRRDRGYLIESDLRNVTQATYDKFISIVQEDKVKAELPKNYATDANRLINALTDQHFNIADGAAPKTPEWEDMARRARDKYSAYVNEGIDAGMEQHVAQREALDRLRENFAAGTYTKDPTITPNTQYLQKLKSARLTMSQRPDLDKYVIANTNAEIQQLVAYTKGQADIPKLYYDLARNQRNLTAWDIAAAQFRAAGYGQLTRGPKKVAADLQDPDVQAILRYKPNQNRLNRAQSQSFNGSGSFERPASVTYESPSGQPGVDLYFPSKRFPAVLGGVVKDVSRQGGPGTGYGNYVVIESTDPLTGKKVDVLYGHLADNSVTVRPGQTINPGQIIGQQGGTGRVVSADGTIASIDFLAPRGAGSKDMTPYSNFDRLRRYVVQNLQRGGGSPASDGPTGNRNADGYLKRLAYLETRIRNIPNEQGSGALGFFQAKDAFDQEAVSASGGISPRDPDYNKAAKATWAWIQRYVPDAAKAIRERRFNEADRLLRSTWPSLPFGSQAQADAVQKEARRYLN
jgi:murein DD-endopeptidase MepM/ murein hydrolase activator NlpD